MAYPSSPKLGLRIVGWARMNDPTDEQGRLCVWAGLLNRDRAGWVVEVAWRAAGSLPCWARYGCSWGVHGWLVEAWGAGDCGCCWCAGKGPPEAAIHVKQQFT
ncbi:hypothetical protein V6N11_037423 [Hibiscus sabdariffa]|uniref:Uncharacterized protein n=1 Tax=Hibiscus sabdariffa TaxID=183260 RepID=A0ABR2P1G4_9ROSI